MNFNGSSGALGPTTVEYARDQVIFEEGDEARLTFRVCSGWVRLQTLGADGVRKIVAFIGPGETFGACAGSNFASAEAVTPLSLQPFDVLRLAGLLAERPEFALQFVTDSQSREASMASHLNALLRLSAPGRVLEFLAATAARVPADPSTGLVRLPMTREDISDFLGVAPATLSRVLTKLQKDGWLRLSGPRNFAVGAPSERSWQREGWRNEDGRLAARTDRFREAPDAFPSPKAANSPHRSAKD